MGTNRSFRDNHLNDKIRQSNYNVTIKKFERGKIKTPHTGLLWKRKSLSENFYRR